MVFRRIGSGNFWLDSDLNKNQNYNGFESSAGSDPVGSGSSFKQKLQRI